MCKNLSSILKLLSLRLPPRVQASSQILTVVVMATITSCARQQVSGLQQLSAGDGLSDYFVLFEVKSFFCSGNSAAVNQTFSVADELRGSVPLPSQIRICWLDCGAAAENR